MSKYRRMAVWNRWRSEPAGGEGWRAREGWSLSLNTRDEDVYKEPKVAWLTVLEAAKFKTPASSVDLTFGDMEVPLL